MIIAAAEGYYSAVIYILAGILGICVGSFLNVVIYRLPLGQSLSKPGSHCPKCGKAIKAYDNIPIISYIMLRGKCRNCKEHIPFRYTAVEAANGILWVISAVVNRENLIQGILCAIVSSVSICIFYIDKEHMIIYDRFQVILAAVGVVSIFSDISIKWYDHIIGMAAGGIIFITTAVTMKRVMKREALGGGDIKLAISSGLILGWQRFILMMLISSVSGSIILLILKKKEGESKEHAFGPYMAVGLVISMIYGERIIEWYMRMIMN